MGDRSWRVRQLCVVLLLQAKLEQRKAGLLRTSVHSRLDYPFNERGESGLERPGTLGISWSKGVLLGGRGCAQGGVNDGRRDGRRGGAQAGGWIRNERGGSEVPICSISTDRLVV